jgi:ADP-ribose pyrophosphatase YjhB (NUDIX family)
MFLHIIRILNFKIKIMKLASFTLIENNDNYLLVQENSLRWKNHWFLPGGKSEKDESPEQTARREAKEEIGCDIDLKEMFYTKYSPGIIVAELCFYYYANPSSPIDMKNQHSLKSRWFTYDEITKLPLRENARDIIDTYRNLKKRRSAQINEYA